MTAPIASRSAERYFYTGMALAMLAAVFLGFARTFFLSPWFADAASSQPPEPFFFYVHGVLFTAWMLLMVLQPALVAGRQIQLHRRIGWFGAGLAALVVVVGVLGALVAAGRPGGFIGVPVPPLVFLAIPLGDLALFAVFATSAIVCRRDAQCHKRLMLLATIGLLDAAIVRWPFSNMGAAIAGPLYSVTDLGVDLFLVPMVVWDLASRRRLHPVTLFGGLTVIASHPLRVLLSGTDAWLAFAAWAVGRVY
jgi:hypothetical protein